MEGRRLGGIEGGGGGRGTVLEEVLLLLWLLLLDVVDGVPFARFIGVEFALAGEGNMAGVACELEARDWSFTNRSSAAVAAAAAMVLHSDSSLSMSLSRCFLAVYENLRPLMKASIIHLPRR